MNFSVVVFDTAPTGHTLRLLTFPIMMEKAIEKLLDLKNRIGPYLNQLSMLFGAGVNIDDIAQKFEDILATIKTVNQQFKNPVSKHKIFLKSKNKYFKFYNNFASGSNNICLCMHCWVFVVIWNRKTSTGINQKWNWHS